MSSFSRLLNITLGLTAVGCGVLAYQQYYLLESARNAVATLEKERTALREKLDRLEKSRADRPRWSPAPSTNTGPVPVAETGSETGGAPVPRPEGGGFNRARAFMESPQAQQYLAMQQKAALDGRYAALFRKLQLSPEDLEKFKTLLVERQTAVMDVMTAARNQGIDPRSNGSEISQLIRDAQNDVDATIRTTLGDSGYQDYKDYEHTLPQRATVSQLEQRLSYTSTPLRADQVDQLARILADTSPPPRTTDARNAVYGYASSFNTPVPSGAAGGFFGGSMITDDAVARAQGVLTTSQMEALKQVQQEQQLQAQVAAEMRGRFGRGSAPTSSASPTTSAVAVPAVQLPGGG